MALNEKNLDKLIDHLQAMPKKAFNLARWYDANGSGPIAAARDKASPACNPRAARSLIRKQREADGTHPCGTSACIAGYAVILQRAERGATAGTFHGWKDMGAEWLGLSEPQAYALFTPQPFSNAVGPDRLMRGREGVTLGEAIRVLKHLRETGLVDWRVAKFRNEVVDETATGISA